jgi:pSer/pThr/pTyr-binding forkhead associated (FHA) protein
MIQLQILNGKMAGVTWTARHFPVRIGRNRANDLQLEDPGIWDNHLTVELTPAGDFLASTPPQATATFNQQPSMTHRLRAGDSIEIGSARLRFWISPPQRTSLTFSEATVWVIILIIFIAQVLVITRLDL